MNYMDCLRVTDAQPPFEPVENLWKTCGKRSFACGKPPPTMCNSLVRTVAAEGILKEGE